MPNIGSVSVALKEETGGGVTGGGGGACRGGGRHAGAAAESPSEGAAAASHSSAVEPAGLDTKRGLPRVGRNCEPNAATEESSSGAARSGEVAPLQAVLPGAVE